MMEKWKEPFSNFVGMHILILYIAVVALICRYWIAPFLP